MSSFISQFSTKVSRKSVSSKPHQTRITIRPVPVIYFKELFKSNTYSSRDSGMRIR